MDVAARAIEEVTRSARDPRHLVDMVLAAAEESKEGGEAALQRKKGWVIEALVPFSHEGCGVPQSAELLRQHGVLELSAALLPELDEICARCLALVRHPTRQQ